MFSYAEVAIGYFIESDREYEKAKEERSPTFHTVKNSVPLQGKKLRLIAGRALPTEINLSLFHNILYHTMK